MYIYIYTCIYKLRTWYLVPVCGTFVLTHCQSNAVTQRLGSLVRPVV